MKYVIARETYYGKKYYFQWTYYFNDGNFNLSFTDKISSENIKCFSGIEEAKNTIQKLLEFEKIAQKLHDGDEIKPATYKIIVIRSEIVKFETEAVFSVENSVSDIVQEEPEIAFDAETALQTELETLNEDCPKPEQDCIDDKAISELTEEELTDLKLAAAYDRIIREEEGEKPQYQRVIADVAYSERLKENLQQPAEDLQQPAEELCEEAYQAYKERKAEQEKCEAESCNTAKQYDTTDYQPSTIINDDKLSHDFGNGISYEYKPTKSKIDLDRKSTFRFISMFMVLVVGFLLLNCVLGEVKNMHRTQNEVQDNHETYRVSPEKALDLSTLQPIENKNAVLKNTK